MSTRYFNKSTSQFSRKQEKYKVKIPQHTDTRGGMVTTQPPTLPAKPRQDKSLVTLKTKAV